MPSAPDVSVVIPTYRRADGLAALVAALEAQTLERDRFEVVMVDNASGDTTWETLDALRQQASFTLTLEQTAVNHGPAPARNLGWKMAAAPVVAFLDDDCLPDPGWLAAGLAAMEAEPEVGIVQGRVRFPDDFDPTVMGTWYHTMRLDGPSPWFESCNIFYRRAALEDGGGFDETFGWWGEDSALGWQVVEAGWGRSFSVDAAVVHTVQERGWRWYVRTGLLERNTVKLAGDHPGFRREAFWMPWAFRPDDVAFVVATVGLLGALRWRPAAVLALPYAWRRRPRAGLQGTPRFVAQSVAVDAARSVGQIWGAVAHRVAVI